MRITNGQFLGLSAAACVFMADTALASAPGEATNIAKPVVVEMFVSQSCNSCMAASELMNELASRDDVVALSWHVDYWNMLNTKSGRWADPYSAAAYTARQKTYNLRIRNRSSVYTPQAIVNGAAETVGSSGQKIWALIDDAASESAQSETKHASVVAAMDDDHACSFKIAESETGGNAYLVTFKRRVATHIPRGENAGKVFNGVNIVTGVQPLGVVLKSGAELSAPMPADDEGCALIVQEPTKARIVAAAYCPTS